MFFREESLRFISEFFYFFRFCIYFYCFIIVFIGDFEERKMSFLLENGYGFMALEGF